MPKPAKPYIVIFICLFSTSSYSQECPKPSTYPVLTNDQVNIYIPGYSDSTQKNGLKVRAIDMNSLVKGFKLVSDDKEVFIDQFALTFHADGTIYTFLKSETWRPQFAKIKDATIVTIGNIVVKYLGSCYRLEGQVYLRKELH